MLNQIGAHLAPEKQNKLLAPITAEEIERNLKICQKKKSLGLDGLTFGKERIPGMVN
jgi:hypothetical protein